MDCKNCGTPLLKTYAYCPVCGAKVIKKRLTFRSLCQDIVVRYLDLDNSFFKTLRHMVYCPEKVTIAYIDGVRKRYLNPFSLLGISFFLSGINLLLLRKYAWDRIDFDDLFGGGAARRTLEITMEFNSLIYLLYLPVMAIGGLLLFNSRKYNLWEHLVIATFSLAAFNFLLSLVTIGWVLIHPQHYLMISILLSIVMMLYTLFVYIRLSQDSWWLTLLKGIGYCCIFFGGIVGTSLFVNLLLLLFGIISFEDFAPK
ncbi:MAG: DUF3667 domain-containing protein [Bacteroidota bacterium]